MKYATDEEKNESELWKVLPFSTMRDVRYTPLQKQTIERELRLIPPDQILHQLLDWDVASGV